MTMHLSPDGHGVTEVERFDQGPVWETCLAVSSISVDPSTLLTGTNFLQAVHVPKEKKKQL